MYIAILASYYSNVYICIPCYSPFFFSLYLSKSDKNYDTLSVLLWNYESSDTIVAFKKKTFDVAD